MLIAAGWARVKRLVEMMMRIDETGQNDMLAGVEDLAWGRRLGSRGHQFGDDPPVDHEAAFGPLGEDGEWILDPEALLRQVRPQ